MQTGPTSKRRNSNRRKSPNPDSRTYNRVLLRTERHHHGSPPRDVENSAKRYSPDSSKRMGVPPSVDGELTLEQLWADKKMDEICTKDALWESAQTSEILRTLTPEDEETCRASHNPPWHGQ